MKKIFSDQHCELIVCFTHPDFSQRTESRIGELRLDSLCSKRSDCANLFLQLRRHQPAMKILATLRLQEEYGCWQGSDAERLLWFETILPLTDMVDIEIRSPTAAPLIAMARRLDKPVIASWHGRSDRCQPQQMADQAKKLGAQAIKIAVLCNTLDELLPVASWLAAGTAADQLPRIAVGMGVLGPLSRMLLPLLGSKAGYASLDHLAPAAPGQLPYTVLCDFLNNIDDSGDSPHNLSSIAARLCQLHEDRKIPAAADPAQLRAWLMARPWRKIQPTAG